MCSAKVAVGAAPGAVARETSAASRALGVASAYAAAIPGARFQLLTETGHMPRIETPYELIDAVWTFAGAHASLCRDLLNTVRGRPRVVGRRRPGGLRHTDKFVL